MRKKQYRQSRNVNSPHVGQSLETDAFLIPLRNPPRPRVSNRFRFLNNPRVSSDLQVSYRLRVSNRGRTLENFRVSERLGYVKYKANHACLPQKVCKGNHHLQREFRPIDSKMMYAGK